MHRRRSIAATSGIGYGVPQSIPTGKVTLAIQVEALKDAAAAGP